MVHFGGQVLDVGLDLDHETLGVLHLDARIVAPLLLLLQLVLILLDDSLASSQFFRFKYIVTLNITTTTRLDCHVM